jgi:hypothetical protein
MEDLSLVYLADIYLDVCRYLVGQAANGKRAAYEVKFSTFLHSYRVANEHYRDFDNDWLIERHFVEIYVEKTPAHGVHLDFANEHLFGSFRSGILDLEIEKLALSARFPQKFFEL